MCKMNFWNTKVLPSPPINTYKTANKNIDINHLYNVLQEGKQFFDDNKYMSAEYVVLSRIVYRMKQKFRTAKDFKALEKLNKALDNYFEVGISSNIKKLMDLIPFRYKDETYLPTKNLLDYILVRLQGLAKLMERIVETSRIAAYLLEKRMNIGHFWKIAFITFSLISRIYVLAKYTTKFICEFYCKLLPFSHQLKNPGREWLPQGYALPKDLKEWMNVDWLEFDDEVQIVDIPTEIPDIMQFFDLVNDDDDDIEFCNEYFLVDDDDDVEAVKEFKKICNTKSKTVYSDNLEALRGFDCREDIGEIIEINDSLLDEEQNTEDVADISEINILSDTDKSEIVILDNTSQSELEENSRVNSPAGFTEDIHEPVVVSKQNNYIELNETREESVINISDVSLMEITDGDDKSEENYLESNNNIENELTKSSKSALTSDSNLINHNGNSLFICGSEGEVVVIETDGENIETVSDTSIMEVRDIGEEKKKIKNSGKLKNNFKLSQMENRRNEVNINTNFLFSSDVESNSIVIKNSNKNDISIMEVLNNDKIKKRKKRNRNNKSVCGSNNITLLEAENYSAEYVNRSAKSVVFSPENSNSVIETDRDITTVSDTSLRKAENRIIKKKKKLKRSIEKCDKMLKSIRSKINDDVHTPSISNPAHFNVIINSCEKNTETGANVLLRDDKVIKKKKGKLKQKTKDIRALESVKNNDNKTKADNGSLNENHGDTITSYEQNTVVNASLNMDKCDKNTKIKDKLKKSNIKTSDTLTKMRAKVLKKKKNKLRKNIDTKIKKFEPKNENIEGVESIINEHAKIKKNKLKRRTESDTELKDNFLKSNNKRLKKGTKEGNTNAVKNKKNRFSVEVSSDNKKRLNNSAESFDESQLLKKLTEPTNEINSILYLQKKVIKQHKPNKNYEYQLSIGSASTSANSRKRKRNVEDLHKFKKLDNYMGNKNDSVNTKKKHKKIKQTHSSPNVSVKQDIKG